MSSFSVGILHSAVDLLRLASTYKFSPADFLAAYRARFDVASPQATLHAVQEAGWIELSHDGIAITALGQAVLSVSDPQERLRLQLRQLIAKTRPSWGALMTKGRTETMPFLTESARQCFVEAGLVGSQSNEIQEWWDQLANAYRAADNELRLRLGRAGERLTLEYEEHRTSKVPRWQALDSNLAGYDVLSVVDSTDLSPLCIEVKTTSREYPQDFFLTRNEWDMALATPAYRFYLWNVGAAESTLRIASPQELHSHVPKDEGMGKWSVANIPFEVVPISYHKSINYVI